MATGTQDQTTPWAENARRAMAATDVYLDAALAETEEKIAELLGGDAPFVTELLQYAAGPRGKRFRSRLTLLAAATSGVGVAHAPDLAACIECLHLATLMHDDVIDEAATRRGRVAVHRRFGNRLSILGGDYVFTRVFLYVVQKIRDREIIDVFASVTNRMVAGEFFQMWRQGRLDVEEEEYLHIITLKSAKLMAASCEVGALAAGYDGAEVRALEDFGLNAGLSFQITDDWLDFSSSAEALGKDGFADVRSGKVTLPLIFGLKSPHGEDVAAAVAAIWEGDAAEGRLRDLLQEEGALARTHATAREYAERGKTALLAIPPGEARDLLADLADWTWQRSF